MNLKMNVEEILGFFLKKGLLVDKEVLNLLSEAEDIETVKLIVEKIGNQTNKKIITKRVFEENREEVRNIFSNLPEENLKKVESLKVKLGLSIEISKEVATEIIKKPEFNKLGDEEVRIISTNPALGKKLEVGDFVKSFRSRYNELKTILQDRQELNNLVSINKISGSRQGISVIAMISDKKVTKNKNIIFGVEDLTGTVKILVNQNKSELYKKAEEVTLDSVLGFKCSGNSEILFANDIIFPESALLERKKSPVEEYVLFLGDLHFGSKRFMEENFLKFLDYLNGKLENSDKNEIEKIKYLFLVGDIVTGVGNYPDQEIDLKIKDLEEQFSKLAELLDKIPKRIKIIISPGNHDGVRLMEPQPLINEKYAWPLYRLSNIIFTSNPAELNIGAKEGFGGFNVLTYHGFSFPYYANTIPSLVAKRAMNCPDEIAKFLLKYRHLAPSHASVQYFPTENDALLIKHIPDIFVFAHTHKSAVSYYKNILLISISCWEEMTPYQEKFGNTPDHCKVPIFNLKTRAIKILDFE